MNGIYQKYGSSDTRGMGEALQQSQKATNDSFTDVLKGVDGLMKTVEKGYIEDNTLRLQDYLRNNIKQAGLAAEAPQMDRIVSQFGPLIDKDVLGKTITETRTKMVTDENDKSQAAAGEVFRETKDFNAATRKFQETFAASGAPASLVQQQTKAFYQDNQFMPEMVKLEDSNRVQSAVNSAYSQAYEYGDQVGKEGKQRFSIDDIKDATLAATPEHLKMQVLDEFKKRENLSRTLTDKENKDLLFVDAQLANTAAIRAAHDDQMVAQAKAAYDAVNYNPLGATEGAKAWAQKMGGLNKAYTEDATGLWFAAGKNILEENEVPEAMNVLKNNLLKEGIDPAEADGILFEAYNQNRIQGVGGGVGVRPDALKATVNAYVSLHKDSLEKQSVYTAAQATALENKLKMAGERNSLVHELRTKAGDSKIYGTNYDILGSYGKKAKEAITTPVTAASGKSQSTPQTTAPVDAFQASLDRAKSKTGNQLKNVALKDSSQSGPSIPSKGSSKATGVTASWDDEPPSPADNVGNWLKKKFTNANKGTSTIDVKTQRAQEAERRGNKGPVDKKAQIRLSAFIANGTEGVKEGKKLDFVFEGKRYVGVKTKNGASYKQVK